MKEQKKENSPRKNKKNLFETKLFNYNLNKRIHTKNATLKDSLDPSKNGICK